MARLIFLYENVQGRGKSNLKTSSLSQLSTKLPAEQAATWGICRWPTQVC